jgi:hypothetical protein
LVPYENEVKISHKTARGRRCAPRVRWLIWHHLYGWLSKAEFTLGLALALTHAMGLVKLEHRQFFDDRNRGIFLHTDLLTLPNPGSLMNWAPWTRPFARPGIVKSIGYLAPNCRAPACR